MALRYYINFTSLRGEALRVEIHDTEHLLSATEIDGAEYGVEMDWGGEAKFTPGVMPASVRFSFLHNGGLNAEGFISAIVGSAEGRFHIVVKREGVPYPFYLVPDQVNVPDMYKNFHVELFGVDGMARLKDFEYKDVTTGEPYTGRQTVVGHLFNIIEHIGLTGIVSLDTQLLHTSGNWYDVSMDASTCPYGQVTIDHDRFKSKDRDGNDDFFSVYDVLDAICRQFGCRFLFSQGRYYFQQLELYQDATQKVFAYNAAGSLVATLAAVDYDIDVDYANAAKAKKVTGGIKTYFQAIKKVLVNYQHVTIRNLLQGQEFGSTIFNNWVTLPGSTLSVPSGTETRMKLNFRVTLIPNVSGISGTLTIKYMFTVEIKAGNYYLKNRIINDLTDPADFFEPIEYETPEWTLTPSVAEFVTAALPPGVQGFTTTHDFSFTTPALPTAADGENLEFRFLAAGGNPDTGGAVASPDVWELTQPSLVVYNDDILALTDSDVLTFEQTAPEANSGIFEIDTYFGDGPNPLSLGKLKKSAGVDTSAWQVGGTGTSYDLNELLAIRLLRLMKKPMEVFQVTWLHQGIYPTSRMTDGTRNYMAITCNYSSFRDMMAGEFVRISIDAAGVLIGNQYNGNPIPGPLDPGPLPPVPVDPPYVPSPAPIGIGGIRLSGLNGNQTAASINAGTFNRLVVNPQDYPFARVGDTVRLMNPATSHSEVFTVSQTYQPGDTFLYITEDAVQDFPNGSYILPNAEMLSRGSGWAYKQTNFTGTEINVPKTTALLPDPDTTLEAAIDARLRVSAGGVEMYFKKVPGPGEYTIDVSGGSNKIILYQKIRGATVKVVGL